ncbi:MAG: helix-turn-helix domain-containing protein [Lachnospiraceae bacterium]|nr:helix-turn-helix domain-containing protein [Lachnospiraceae bacterium]
MDTKKIGEFLKKLRKEKGLTQEQLAEILFVSGRTISRWETGTNMPDLSILIQMAEFYDVEIKEILEGERKNGIMEKELKETLSKVADYNKLEKEKAAKVGNIAFGLFFFVCAAAIVIQLIVTGALSIVAGETVTLLVGGVAYIGIMVYNGVWETGSKFKSTPLKDILISVMCSGIFTAALIFCYIRLGAEPAQTAYIASIFFVGITLIGFVVLRILAYCNHKKSAENKTVRK